MSKNHQKLVLPFVDNGIFPLPSPFLLVNILCYNSLHNFATEKIVRQALSLLGYFSKPPKTLCTPRNIWGCLKRL